MLDQNSDRTHLHIQSIHTLLMLQWLQHVASSYPTHPFAFLHPYPHASASPGLEPLLDRIVQNMTRCNIQTTRVRSHQGVLAHEDPPSCLYRFHLLPVQASTLLWNDWCLFEFLLQQIVLNLLKPLSTFCLMIPLPGRALSAAVLRSMSVNHSLSDVHVPSDNLCRFPWCGFPGCEPNVLKHLCIPTEFNWHPSHCSDLLNSSLKVHHQVRIINFTLAYSISLLPTQMPLANLASHLPRPAITRAASRYHNCSPISAISPLYSRPKMSLYDDPP